MDLDRVPFIPDFHIEQEARRLLGEYARAMGRDVRPPIPVDEIIEKYLHLHLEIDDLQERFGRTDALGAIWFEEETIAIDESLLDQEGRFAFTAAHEVGHWRLHRPLVEADKVTLFDRAGIKVEPTVLCRGGDHRKRGEIQADRFAAALLMPEREVRAAFEASFGQQHVIVAEDAVPEGFDVIAYLREIARRIRAQGSFDNVSLEAMRVRLEHLKLVLVRKPGDPNQESLTF